MVSLPPFLCWVNCKRCPWMVNRTARDWSSLPQLVWKSIDRKGRWLFPSLFVTSTCERLIPSSGQWTHAAMKTWWDLFSTGPSLGKEFLQRVTGGLGWRPGNALMPKLDGWWLQTFFNVPSPTYKLFELSKMIFDKMWLYNNQTIHKLNQESWTKSEWTILNEQNKSLDLGSQKIPSVDLHLFSRSFLGQHLDVIRSLESWSYVPHSFCRSFWKVVPWKRTGKEWRCFRDFPEIFHRFLERIEREEGSERWCQSDPSWVRSLSQ